MTERLRSWLAHPRARPLLAGGLGLAAVVAVGWAVLGGAPGGRFLPVLDAADQRAAAAAVQALEGAGIPVRVLGDTQIMVPESAASRARLVLARAPGGGGAAGAAGYELLDRGDGLTSSAFQQHATLVRAMEGEIARSLQMIAGIRSARVHLAMARPDPFNRRAEPPRAAVVLRTTTGGRVSEEQAEAALQVVLGALPGLAARQVTIVDQHGTVRAGGESGTEAGAPGRDPVEQQRQAMERRLTDAVAGLLARVAGPDRAEARIAVELNHETVQELSEMVQPDARTPRSVQTSSMTARNPPEPRPVTVRNNLPGEQEAEPARDGTTEERREETINYEVSRTVRRTDRTRPTVRRITAAVVMDEALLLAEGAEPRPGALPVATVEDLVKAAVGFDADRGDVVRVVAVRLAEAAQAPGGGMTDGLLEGVGSSQAIELLKALALVAVAVLLLRLLARAGTVAPPAIAADAQTPALSVPIGPAPEGRLLSGSAEAAPGTAPGGTTADPEEEARQRIMDRLRQLEAEPA